MPRGTTAPPLFPFIVGCGRSGTSLLRAMFDSHPDMNIPPDTYFILGLAEKRKRYERADGFAIEAFIADLRSGFNFDRWPASTEIADDLLASPPADFPDAIRQIFRVWARLQGKTRYGNKSPVHVRSIAMLGSLFPEARFIHIIRDGRDVALSYMDVEFGPKSIEGGAIRWRRHVTEGRKGGAALGVERYREVRYEQLVADPHGTLRELCDFIGLDFDEQMLRYYARVEQLYPGNETPHHHRHLAKPPTKGMRDWRVELSPDQIATFGLIAGSLAEELGYEPSPRGGLRLRAKALGRLFMLWIRPQMRHVRKTRPFAEPPSPMSRAE